MTSNIEAIRAAEAHVPQLREKLKDLREEALADDGKIDAQEQVEIDRVEAKIDTTQRMIEDRRRAWEANKAAYIKLRSKFASDLAAVVGAKTEEYGKDQSAVIKAAENADKAAGDEDFATALTLASELQRLVALFRKLMENERLAGLTTQELMDEKLATDKIDEVFTEDYMRGLMTAEFKGEGDPKLKDLMAEIEKGFSSTRRPEVMKGLETVAGLPPSAAEFDADYARFLVLRKQRDAIGNKKNNGPVESVDEKKHPDFGASRGQLMFGRVLGDALGIHEIFASILSPTGGLVGPGNELIPGVIDSPHLSPDNPVALHGTVHDAAGYLKSFHNEGPGYNYRNDLDESIATFVIELMPESIQKEVLPLTGQISGIEYWAMEAGDEYIEARYDEGVLALEKALATARNGAAAEIGELVSAYEETKKDLKDAANAAADEVEKRKKQAEKDLLELAKKAEQEALDAKSAFEKGIDSIGNSVIEVVEDISDGVRSIGSGAKKKLDSLANFIWS